MSKRAYLIGAMVAMAMSTGAAAQTSGSTGTTASTGRANSTQAPGMDGGTMNTKPTMKKPVKPRTAKKAKTANHGSMDHSDGSMSNSTATPR